MFDVNMAPSVSIEFHPIPTVILVATGLAHIKYNARRGGCFPSFAFYRIVA